MRNIKLTLNMMEKILMDGKNSPIIEYSRNNRTSNKKHNRWRCRINASGRTDAGVHALGQVANFKTNSQIPIEKFAIAINSRLKKSIVIKKAEEVDERFHSRLNCKRKTYRYIINNSPYGTAIYRYLETHIPQKLNVEKMKKAVKYFIGEHDFKAFKASGTSSKSSVRTIYEPKYIKMEIKFILN